MIANIGLRFAASNIYLESREAQACIEETASSARESTAAGRLADVFPLANFFGEVEIQVDPSQLHLNEGPQHEFLMTGTIDEIKCQFDPYETTHIAWDAPHGFLHYDGKVMSNFRGLEQNWRDLRNGNFELQRTVYNPVSRVIVYGVDIMKGFTGLVVELTLRIVSFLM